MLTRLFAAVLALALLSPVSATAQQITTGWMTQHAYQAFLDNGQHGNLAPLRVLSSVQANGVNYNATFGPLPAGYTQWATQHGLSNAAFAQLNRTYLNQGFTLIHHDRTNAGGYEANQGIWYR